MPERLGPVLGGGSSSGGGVTPGALLKTTYLNTFENYVLTGTLAAIDATNATIAFTVPASGIVDIDAKFLVEILTGATGSNYVSAGLLDHTTHAQVGETFNNIVDYGAAPPANGILEYVTCRWHLTGLTPGAKQLDLAAAFGGATLSAHIGVDGQQGSPTNTFSPLIIQAFASV